ncbi:HAD family hydrolase [Chloroflexota bacterium]
MEVDLNTTGGLDHTNEIVQDIKTIIFDLDGTLRHNLPSRSQTFVGFLSRFGIENDPEKRRCVVRWEHYYWAQSEELAQDLLTFQVSAFNEVNDPFWINYMFRDLRAFGCPPEQAHELAPEVALYMEENYQPEDWIPPEVPTTLQALKENGFQLGLLSNRREPIHEKLEDMGLHSYFNLALFAGEVNSWKPDPQIFHYALNHLDTSARQTAYVGDNYYSDIIGAQRAGVNPVLLDPEGIFPEADCPVIKSIQDLLGLIES